MRSLAWLTVFVVVIGACRSDEEQEYIDDCTDVCQRQHAEGCGAGNGPDACEEECEEKCDDVFGDCFQQEIRALECRQAAASVCSANCTEEDGDVFGCSLADAIVPFSAGEPGSTSAP